MPGTAAPDPLHKLTRLLEQQGPKPPPDPALVTAFTLAVDQTKALVQTLKDSVTIQNAFFGAYLRDDESKFDASNAIDLALWGAVSALTVFGKTDSPKKFVPMHRFTKGHEKLMTSLMELPTGAERAQLIKFADTLQVAFHMRRAANYYQFANANTKTADQKDGYMRKGLGFTEEAAAAADLDEEDTLALRDIFWQGGFPDVAGIDASLDKGLKKTVTAVMQSINPPKARR